MNTDNMKFETKLVKIDQLVTDDLQTRAKMHEDCISDYAKTYRTTPEKMPPVTVFYDSMRDEHYLADGFHRVAACKMNGSDTVLAKVFEGEYNDALEFAVGANAGNNSIYRSHADKHRAMEIAWANWRMLLGDKKPLGQANGEDNGLPSARQFAALCCVHPDTANEFLKLARVSETDTPPAAKTADGIVIPEISDDTPDALTVTKAHLEERDQEVRAKLKDGKDRFGIDIPEKLMDAFRSRVPQQLVRGLNGMYSAFEKRRLEGDVVFAPFVGRAMTHLDNLINTIRHGTVYCVCRMCRGEGCGSCNELGFQTRAQYDRNPTEFKAEKE